MLNFGNDRVRILSIFFSRGGSVENPEVATLCPDEPHQHLRVEFEDVDTGKDGMILEAGETKDGEWVVEQVHLPLNDPGAISDMVEQLRAAGNDVDLGNFEQQLQQQLQQLPSQQSAYKYTDDDEELGGFYL